MAKVLNGPDSSLFCRDARSIRGGGQSNFFLRSLSLLLSKPKISIYLCVFVIESPFFIAWKDLGLICLLAGIVTLTFGSQSIDYFNNTNSELTC